MSTMWIWWLGVIYGGCVVYLFYEARRSRRFDDREHVSRRWLVDYQRESGRNQFDGQPWRWPISKS